MLLVDAIVDRQNMALIRLDDPVLMARFIWPRVHGISMLVIDGKISEAGQSEALELYAIERLRASLEAAD